MLEPLKNQQDMDDVTEFLLDKFGARESRVFLEHITDQEWWENVVIDVSMIALGLFPDEAIRGDSHPPLTEVEIVRHVDGEA